MPARIAIAAAKAFADQQGLDQVIIAGWDGERTHVVTWGRSIEDCDQAAMGGDKIKAALGWPETVEILPSRVKRARAERDTALAKLAAIQGPDVYAALRLMNFQTGPVAHLLRATGEDIPRKGEDEQAFVLQWLIGLVLEHGSNWHSAAMNEVDRRRVLLEERRETAKNEEPQ